MGKNNLKKLEFAIACLLEKKMKKTRIIVRTLHTSVEEPARMSDASVSLTYESIMQGIENSLLSLLLFEPGAGMPKKGRNAYIIYTVEQREAVKQQFPELKNKKLMAKLGELWKALSDEEKKLYETKAAKEKKDAVEEMKKWRRENPDGEKTRAEWIRELGRALAQVVYVCEVARFTPESVLNKLRTVLQGVNTEMKGPAINWLKRHLGEKFGIHKLERRERNELHSLK